MGTNEIDAVIKKYFFLKCYGKASAGFDRMYLMFGQVGNLDEFQNADIRPRFLKGELKGVIDKLVLG